MVPCAFTGVAHATRLDENLGEVLKQLVRLGLLLYCLGTSVVDEPLPTCGRLGILGLREDLVCDTLLLGSESQGEDAEKLCPLLARVTGQQSLEPDAALWSSGERWGIGGVRCSGGLESDDNDETVDDVDSDVGFSTVADRS